MPEVDQGDFDREAELRAAGLRSVLDRGFWNPPHTYSPPFLPPVAGEPGWELGDAEYEASLVEFDSRRRFRGARKGLRS